MRHFHRFALLFLPVLMLALAGCGSSSSGTADPFVPGTDTPTTPTGNGTVLSYSLVLSLTPTSGQGSTVGPNSTVIATATLKDSTGSPVANQPIKYEAIEGAVTIDPAIVSTDSTGKSVNFLKAGGSTTSATDVIVKASSTVKGQLVTAIGIFTIIRSESNIIKFVTTKGPTDPDGTLNTLKVVLDNVTSGGTRTILQLVPFQVLDNNGVPRARVPVKISVYEDPDALGVCPVTIQSPEEPEHTVTTDDSGMGIFNVGVDVQVPDPGDENACSVIYKAETEDPNDASLKIFAYGGFLAVLQNTKPQ